MIVDKNSPITAEVDFDSELTIQVTDMESLLGDTIRDKDSMIALFVDMDSILIGYESC